MLISRQNASGMVAFCVFLVDRFCLGVKDGFGNVVPRQEYEREARTRFRNAFPVVDLTPSCARKLVEGSVAYARDLGLDPHPDYHEIKPIFEHIDCEECTKEFEFGENGKPLFVAGPYEAPERCAQIIRVLKNRCGEDAFHFIVPYAIPGTEGARVIHGDDDGKVWEEGHVHSRV